ncbi:MAG: DUF362 domain-containing protein [Candidatus Latescibacterota bacterium]
MTDNQPAGMGRRGFLRTAGIGIPGMTAFGCASRKSAGPKPGKFYTTAPGESRVAFTTGNERISNLLAVLKPFEKEIRAGIQGKQVVIKLNCVGQKGSLLMVTHPDAVRAVLDFLTPLTKERILIAESAVQQPNAPRWDEVYGYRDLERSFNAKVVELNNDSTTEQWILDASFRPVGIRVINTLLDPNNYVISLTRLKTHNSVVATLTLKNVVMGAPLKINQQNINEKQKMHASGKTPQLINLNLFRLGQQVRPDFAILDGFECVEGNGPADGTPVDHRIALAGPDFLAVDRLGVELMGIPFEDVGYLNFCASAGLGQADISKIRVIGPDWRPHIRKYKLHDNIERQLKWKKELILKEG